MARTYTTQYGYLSNRDLHSMFAQATWYGDATRNGLSAEERRQLCQEIVNRLALSRNEDSREVRMEAMNGGVRGYYERNSNSIVLNEHCLARSSFYVKGIDFDGNETISIIPVEGMNWTMMSTVYHEDWHGVQFDQNRECINRAYLSYEKDESLYRIQACEKEAKEIGYNAALNAIEMEKTRTGIEENSATAFRKVVELDSFEKALETAKQRYNDDNVELTLAQVAKDRRSGMKPKEMTPSYARINEVYNQNARRQAQDTIRNLQSKQNQNFRQTQQPTNKVASVYGEENGSVLRTNEASTIKQELHVDDGNNLAEPQEDVYARRLASCKDDGLELTLEINESSDRKSVFDGISLTEEGSTFLSGELHDISRSGLESHNDEGHNSGVRGSGGYSSNSRVR